jgi:hypothetical protein
MLSGGICALSATRFSDLATSAVAGRDGALVSTAGGGAGCNVYTGAESRGISPMLQSASLGFVTAGTGPELCDFRTNTAARKFR